jgi:Flp pilus assembly protein TadG
MNRSRVEHRRFRSGVASLEFALLAPVLLMLLLGGTDASLWLRSRLRVERTATELASVVGQYSELYNSDFANIFAAAQLIADSTPVSGTGGAVIVSLIANRGGVIQTVWQQRSGNPIYLSQFGLVGGTPTLPGGYLPPAGQSLIVAEVFTGEGGWQFSSKLLQITAATVSAFSLQQPRTALLTSILPGVRP